MTPAFCPTPPIMSASTTWWRPRWARIWTYPKVFSVKVAGGALKIKVQWIFDGNITTYRACCFTCFFVVCCHFPKHLDKGPSHLRRVMRGVRENMPGALGLNELQSQPQKPICVEPGWAFPRASLAAGRQLKKESRLVIFWSRWC